MKMTVSKIIGGMMFTAIIALVISGCRKDQNEPVKAMDALSAAAKLTQGIPDTLKVPEGNRLVEDAFARGVQIYQVQRSASDPNVFSWVNTAPLATLYGKSDFTQELAQHFAGPSWEFSKGHNKGQRVVARKLKGVTEDVTAIQWLLLEAVPSLSSANNKITYVQRLFTSGGLAPTTGADEQHLGQLDSIPYTARYFFYEAQP